MLKNIWITALAGALFLQHNLMADTPADAMPQREQGLMQTVTMIVLALAFFYFIFWRPEQKRRQALAEQRAALKQGDRVMAMGIVGTVVQIGEQTVILRMYDGSKLEFVKEAVSEVVTPPVSEQS
jgi:preprotein translocase subunit YajC